MSVFDCPSFRSYCEQTFPCYLRGKIEHVCSAGVTFHHAPFKSTEPRSYTDLNGVTLCDFIHRYLHDHTEECAPFMRGKEFEMRKRHQIESFISSIVEAGAPISAPKRKTSTRRKLNEGLRVPDYKGTE